MTRQATNATPCPTPSAPLPGGRPSTRWQTPLAVLILIGVTVATYGRVCGHEFTWWDDQMTLHHNARYNPPSAEGIRETWTHSVDGLYAPVTYSYWGTLAFVAELKETSPHGIHL